MENSKQLFDALNKIQSLECLVNMGLSREKAKGQKELTKLSLIIDKYDDGTLTVEDLANLDVKISIGAIKCLEIAEGDDAEVKLKEKYPKAM